jgi:plastocyanin
MKTACLVTNICISLAVTSLSNSSPIIAFASEELDVKTIEVVENIEDPRYKAAFGMVESFNPSPVYIQQGDTITWRNTAVNKAHAVTSILSYGKPLFFDHILSPKNETSTSDEFSQTFPIPGVFNYYCKLHPYMIGQVVVASTSS